MKNWILVWSLSGKLNGKGYRGLVTNSGDPSFLVGTQDIGPHEVS